MVGSGRKIRSAFSWADEVEEEQQQEQQEAAMAAAAEAAVVKPQKLNPFASARPREVVLQERGIDWRNVDDNLRSPPNSRSEFQKEEEDIESLIAAPAPVFLVAPQKQIPLIFFPPLKYPPKMVIGRILQPEETNQLNGLKIEKEGLHSQNHDKENIFMDQMHHGVQQAMTCRNVIEMPESRKRMQQSGERRNVVHRGILGSCTAGNNGRTHPGAKGIDECDVGTVGKWRRVSRESLRPIKAVDSVSTMRNHNIR